MAGMILELYTDGVMPHMMGSVSWPLQTLESPRVDGPLGIHVGDFLDYINWSGSPILTVVEPMPGHGILDCTKQRQWTEHAFVHLCLCIVDVIWTVASSAYYPDFLMMDVPPEWAKPNHSSATLLLSGHFIIRGKGSEMPFVLSVSAIFYWVWFF